MVLQTQPPHYSLAWQCQVSHLSYEAMVEVALGQQEVVLEGSQVCWQLSMDHHQLPQLPSNLRAATAS